MKYLQTKTNKVIKLIIEWELLRSLLRYILNNALLPFWIRQFASIGLSRTPIKSALVHVKNRCLLSGQGRSVLSFFKLNRFRFKVLALNGNLTGVKRNSW